MSLYKKIPLFHRIMIGFVLGIIVGLIIGPGASMFEFLGTIMIRLLQLVVAPLIMCLMISTIGSVTDMKSFGSIAVENHSHLCGADDYCHCHWPGSGLAAECG